MTRAASRFTMPGVDRRNAWESHGGSVQCLYESHKFKEHTRASSQSAGFTVLGA